MILNITSFPRSGNSFFTITLLQFGLTWKSRGNFVNFRPTGRIYDSQGIGRSVYGVECAPWCDDPVVSGQEDLRPGRYMVDDKNVYVYKRHDIPDNYSGDRIYLVRDGRDVLYSYAHHNVVNRLIIANPVDQVALAAQEISPDAINVEADRITRDPNVQWGDLVEKGMDHPNTKAVVRYENMKKNAMLESMNALGKCGYVVQKVKEPPSFDHLQTFAPHFYWKGIVGGYHGLHPDIIRDFERRNEHTLRRLRYLV